MKGVEITTELLELLGFSWDKESKLWSISYGNTLLRGALCIDMATRNIVFYTNGVKSQSAGVFGFNGRALLEAVHKAGEMSAQAKMRRLLLDTFNEFGIPLEK
jgi:hypothetical protein